MSTLCYIDVETTGTDPRVHSIHRIGGMIEVEGIVLQEFDWRVRPHERAKIEAAAMRVGGVSEEEIRAYPEREVVFRAMTQMLSEYVEMGDRADKMHLVGYNNRTFDDVFLRAWFDQIRRGVFGCFFWPDSIDVMVLASWKLRAVRAQMPSFKLKRVAMTVGLVVDEERLHDPSYDIYLTREILGLL